MARTNRRAVDVRCAQCGVSKSGRGLTHFVTEDGTPQQLLCLRCLNTKVAERAGIPYQHHEFEPMQLTDSSGHKHTFEFQARLFGTGIAVEALERCRGGRRGYEFEVIGEPHEDPMLLLGRLIEKIRRSLARCHVERGTLGWQITDAGVVRGRIGWDPHSAPGCSQPVVTVDGHEFSWAEFGRMLMTYEGWQFKLEIRDRSEEP